jgi:hypothetical protein
MAYLDRLARRGRELRAVLLLVLAAMASGPTLGGGLPARPGSEEGASSAQTEEIIVYTAHQDFMSRVYFLRMDGSVLSYFHYDPYFLADVEIVNNRLYLGEAFAPRVLELDLQTGDLFVVVDDWTLYYFYGVAFDGTYWYVDEWDLNRYEFDGTKDGMASFDESASGSAWDGTYLWTVNDDENLVKCWDVSGWPSLVEIPGNRFAPPTPHCRGLWFDGQYFWTAESIEGAPGSIYRFDYGGAVIDQWTEPAFRGWGAGVLTVERFVLTVDRMALSWTEAITAHSYDVVLGDLGRLREDAGAFTESVLSCLANDLPATTLDLADSPDPGGGWWILVRGVAPDLNLSYDTGSPYQVASRDAPIDASPESCSSALP